MKIDLTELSMNIGQQYEATSPCGMSSLINFAYPSTFPSL